ncbi:hypothetical protein CH352_08000 [Leptospira hartskeerlii]|uniref:DUF4281 domain-containing protein n=1 Tax=Leptospira hartskeerlii TaxID=2023177 RepID=A0A2M9XHB1_9LEPT|nr:ABA4-like family protein [Leptospira hartskeerlii]PJZ27039.1 hypothetical protein CH357_00265 [Leptospira hartskeerlii]PJZ33698.1 hypothetical protein CH352_08000 [Leptospira hartskeerlii]
MTPELTFKLASNFAIIGWLLLAGLSNAKVTKLLVRNGVWPLILSGLYLLILAFHARGGFDFGSLEGVTKLFANPWILLAGWVHYLAFDLFIGIWETKEAESLGISRWILIPCLFFTLMFGPIGYLLFQIVRWRKGGSHASI